MNEQEINKLKDYIKKRYDEVNLDYKLFDNEAQIDTNLTYEEEFNAVKKFIDELLPVHTASKLKKETTMSVQQLKEEQDTLMKAEMQKQEEELRIKFEKEIEKITIDSNEMEKLYSIPNSYIEMVAKGFARGLLLYGETSLGKSYRVKKVIKNLNIKDFLFVSGHITPMKFYQKLYQAKDSLVIFDDVDILGNNIILNMIKASLNENSGNVVEYHTTKKMDIPSSFIFNGRVIILLNDIPNKSSEHLKAIESRVLKYHLKFNREEILTIIFEIAHKFEIENTNMEERLMIAKWIKENTTRATKNLNIRLYLQAVVFYLYDKLNWRELTKNQIISDEYTEMLLQGISDEDWKDKTGLSKSTKDRLRKELGLTRVYNSHNRYL